jgi:hypothetical protein
MKRLQHIYKTDKDNKYLLNLQFICFQTNDNVSEEFKTSLLLRNSDRFKNDENIKTHFWKFQNQRFTEIDFRNQVMDLTCSNMETEVIKHETLKSLETKLH